jgi:hypothetical protein
LFEFDEFAWLLNSNANRAPNVQVRHDGSDDRQERRVQLRHRSTGVADGQEAVGPDVAPGAAKPGQLGEHPAMLYFPSSLLDSIFRIDFSSPPSSLKVTFNRLFSKVIILFYFL